MGQIELAERSDRSAVWRVAGVVAVLAVLVVASPLLGIKPRFALRGALVLLGVYAAVRVLLLVEEALVLVRRINDRSRSRGS